MFASPVDSSGFDLKSFVAEIVDSSSEPKHSPPFQGLERRYGLAAFEPA